ncbi:hypothetical protein Scep_009195 [Stephania cephalantha]|uniref:Uncharacterized protein n=1 Tax=Stephania cephalantha TaxID=152367 RepID=A0AAP0JT99_9MAGN
MSPFYLSPSFANLHFLSHPKVWRILGGGGDEGFVREGRLCLEERLAGLGEWVSKGFTEVSMEEGLVSRVLTRKALVFWSLEEVLHWVCFF